MLEALFRKTAQCLLWTFIRFLEDQPLRQFYLYEIAQQIWFLLWQNSRILQIKSLSTGKILEAPWMQLQHLRLPWQKVIWITELILTHPCFKKKKDTWVRLIIEYTQAQPLALAGAYYSLQIFIGTASSSRIYFADSAGTASPPALFFGVNNMVLDFCSQLVDGTTPTASGNFDITNFLWFAGPSIVYSNTPGN